MFSNLVLPLFFSPSLSACAQKPIAVQLRRPVDPTHHGTRQQAIRPFGREPDYVYRTPKGLVDCYRLVHTGAAFQGAHESPELSHFNLACTQFHIMMQRAPPHGARLYDAAAANVREVHYVVNPALQQRYDKTKVFFKDFGRPLEEIYIFHGTPEKNIASIMTEGFKVGGEEGVPIANGAVYGRGVYAATGPNTPVSYAKGTKCVILARALIGRCGTSHNDPALDSWRPWDDWIVLRTKEQVLPMYVLHLS